MSKVPKCATREARPDWRVLDHAGRVDWHDHRIHWMAKDAARAWSRTRARARRSSTGRSRSGWTGGRGKVTGDLYWVPRPGGVAAGRRHRRAGGAGARAAARWCVVVRRRRRRASRGTPERRGDPSPGLTAVVVLALGLAAGARRPGPTRLVDVDEPHPRSRAEEGARARGAALLGVRGDAASAPCACSTPGGGAWTPARPSGRPRPACRARLRPGLRDGPYTATYRVVSVGLAPGLGRVHVHRRASPAAASAASVADLVDSGGPGTVTTTAFRAVRAVGYAAIAIVVGGLFFLLVVWRPAPQGCRERGWLLGAAAEAMTARVRRHGGDRRGSRRAVGGSRDRAPGRRRPRAPASPARWTGRCCTTCWPPGSGVAWTGRLAAFALVGLALALPAATRRPALRWLLRPARWAT